MTKPRRGGIVVWHDVEFGAYEADLPLWEELAESRGGPILDIGCGTGRVALHLARRGHQVLGVDLEPELVAAAAERGAGLPFEATVGDARELGPGPLHPLVLVPMQLAQMVEGPPDRLALLRGIRQRLAPGGLAALAIVEEALETNEGDPLVPDVREIDGWVYSSMPLDAGLFDGEIRVGLLRQAVSPTGELSDERAEVRLELLTASALEREAEAAGLSPAGRRAVPSTDAHVGSTVVLLENGG